MSETNRSKALARRLLEEGFNNTTPRSSVNCFRTYTRFSRRWRTQGASLPTIPGSRCLLAFPEGGRTIEN